MTYSGEARKVQLDPLGWRLLHRYINRPWRGIVRHDESQEMGLKLVEAAMSDVLTGDGLMLARVSK